MLSGKINTVYDLDDIFGGKIMEQNVKEKNFVSAVIYIRSGEEDTDKNIENLLKVMKEHFEHYEIIFVNDCLLLMGVVDKIKKKICKRRK